jgi:hypothetical protein
MRVERFEVGRGKECPQLLIQGSTMPANIGEYSLLKKAMMVTDSG